MSPVTTIIVLINMLRVLNLHVTQDVYKKGHLRPRNAWYYG